MEITTYYIEPNAPATFTVQDVIKLALSENERVSERTVDKIRSGSPDQVVTGIVTTMFPTLDVINKTAQAGANMIIAHETPYFNQADETEWLKDDEVYKYKRELLDKYKIAIWRFHDHWHSHRPDGIIYGCLLKMGWEKFYKNDDRQLLTLPQPEKLSSIVARLKKALDIPSIRLVGNMDAEIKTVYFCLGFTGIGNISTLKPDLVINGETRETENTEQIRDGLSIGQKTNLLTLSHSVSEEPGMVYCAQWLAPKVPGVKVTSIPSGTPFQYL
ncbi:Nif3-like dinuclear metal center hexameric protein [Mucilaginibacter sp. HD30]